MKQLALAAVLIAPLLGANIAGFTIQWCTY